MGNVFRVINCDGDIEISIYKKANAVFKTNEYNETDNICTYKETINIFNLLKENYELKSQLKGTTHCFDEEEHEKLKKQLENCYCNRTDCSGRIKDSKVYDSLVQKVETQQNEFIEWLEAMSIMYENEYKDIDTAEHYNCVLNKYKEIIGDDK